MYFGQHYINASNYPKCVQGHTEINCSDKCVLWHLLVTNIQMKQTILSLSLSLLYTKSQLHLIYEHITCCKSRSLYWLHVKKEEESKWI